MSTEPNELTAECDRLAEKLKRAEAACAAYVLALRDIGIAAAEFISDWKKGDFQLPRLAQHDAASLDEKLKRHAGVMDIENPGDALLKKQAADTQAHAAEVERAQRAGNNLYLAIVHQMCTNFDGEDRCLEWDVLPFTIKAALKERDTLRSEVERLTKERDEAKATEESSVDFCVGLTGRNIEKVKEALTERAQLRAKAAEDAKEIAGLKAERSEAYRVVEKLFGSSDHDHMMMILQDRLEAEEVLPAEEYEGADGLSDVIKWMKIDRDEARTERDAATARATEAEAACEAMWAALEITTKRLVNLGIDDTCTKAGLAARATTPAEHLAKHPDTERKLRWIQMNCKLVDVTKPFRTVVYDALNQFAYFDDLLTAAMKDSR